MRITKLQTLDFQGLEGTREYSFDKVTVLCQNNQAGKSSLLNAIKFGLTGTGTEGDIVFHGKPKAAVGLDLADGTSIIRQKPLGGSTAVYLSKHKTTKKMLHQALLDSTGVPVDTMKIVSSEEVLRSLSPQKLMDLMLSYTADMLDVDVVASFVPDITDEMRTQLEKRLPNEAFGLATIHDFYKKLNDDRLKMKRMIADRESAIKIFRSVPVPSKTKEELLADEKVLLAAVEEAGSYKEKVVAYNKAKVDLANQKQKIKEYEEAIKTITAEFHEDKEREELEASIKADRELLDSANKAYAHDEQSVASTKKILENINTTICPLSERLVCTTDKTKVTDELKLSLAHLEESMKNQENTIKTITERVVANEKKLREFDKEREAYKRKEFVINELAKLKAQVITLPEAPKAPKIENADTKLVEIRNLLQVWSNLAKADKLENDVTVATPVLEIYEYLCKAFSDKGPVMECIVAKYMRAFEDICNEKAEELHSGMRVKFVAKGGVTVLIDTQGTGTYLGYDSLSGGEKALYIYLMLDMLNSLSGLKILIIDELSVLDKETFDALLALVLKHQETYDQIFLAMVDHSDTLETLDRYGITPVKLEKVAS